MGGVWGDSKNNQNTLCEILKDLIKKMREKKKPKRKRKLKSKLDPTQRSGKLEVDQPTI